MLERIARRQYMRNKCCVSVFRWDRGRAGDSGLQQASRKNGLSGSWAGNKWASGRGRLLLGAVAVGGGALARLGQKSFDAIRCHSMGKGASAARSRPQTAFCGSSVLAFLAAALRFAVVRQAPFPFGRGHVFPLSRCTPVIRSVHPLCCQ